MTLQLGKGATLYLIRSTWTPAMLVRKWVEPEEKTVFIITLMLH